MVLGLSLFVHVGKMKAGSAMSSQPGLFERQLELTEGFRYHPDVLNEEEEHTLVGEIKQLPFKDFEFHGFSGKRRVVSFGWQHDFNHAKLSEADPIPAFLLPVREKAAALAGVGEQDLEHLGWHKDRNIFADVIGISLLSPCTFRFRMKAGRGWQRASVLLAPRSAYLLRGPARNEWDHSIPGVDQLRYSLTFRNFRTEQSP
jgi:alkylated DNA repair dioxygenase AlkB